MRNPLRAYEQAPAFFKLASIYAIVMAILIYGGCPQPPDPGDNSNDNGSTNTNTSHNSNTNGSFDNLNSSVNDNGGDDVDTKPGPDAITWEELVATGDAVPDADGNDTTATFTDFGSPIIDTDGRVAFWARYSGGTGHGGLYVWDDGTIYAVIDDSGDIPVPSATPGVADTGKTFLCNPSTLDIRTQPITWSENGRLLFVSAFSGTGNELMARWSASDRSLVRVVDAQAIADALGTHASATSLTFGNIGRSDDGVVFFELYVYDIAASPTIKGYVPCTAVVNMVGSAGKIAVTPATPIACGEPTEDALGAVPEQGSSAYFTRIQGNTTLSPSGWMLFQGTFHDGADGTHGVYLRPADDYIVRVVDDRVDSAWPGLDADLVLGSASTAYGAIAISTHEHIGVQTPIVDGGSSSNHVILWDFSLGDSGEWTILTTDGGDAVTNLLSGISDGGAVLGLADSLPYIVDNDASTSITDNLPASLDGVALTWGEKIGSINNTGRAVVPYRRSATSTDCLGFWTNEQLLVLADPLLSIPVANITAITAASLPESDRPGRSGILNDSDEAVFRVDLASSNQAIYVGRAQ